MKLQTEDELPPLRDFHGISVRSGSGYNLKICCSPHDKTGNSIKVDYDDIYNRSNHDKSFVFGDLEGQLIILEIHYFGKWEEYEFCEAMHVGWVPEIEKIGLEKDEQMKAFNIFKELLADTEQINEFSIMDKRHKIYSQPEFRSLLIRILNSNQFKEV